MKSNVKFAICAFAASVLAFSVPAQEPINPNIDLSEYIREGSPGSQPAVDASKPSGAIGLTVQNNQGEKLGIVKDVAVELESGRIVGVMLSHGGFLGMGQTITVVPPGALHGDATQKFLTLDVSREKLKGAPKFETTNWNERAPSERLNKLYAFYGEQAYFADDHKASWSANLDRTLVLQGSHVADPARHQMDENDATSSLNADGTWTHKPFANDQATNRSTSRIGHFLQASKLVGTPVKNLQGAKIGKVESLLLDLPSGRVVAVVISSGEFLGIDNELSAVPPTALQFTVDREGLQLDVTKEELSATPHFNVDNWSNYSQPRFAGGVYRAYDVEPYFTSNTVANIDHSRTNVKDHASGTLTPPGQGDSLADVATTAQIRKEIIAGKEMSTNARNVKIVTKDGRVTLRGPVNTSEEKRNIGEIANGVARSENVDNQLAVKLVVDPN